MGINFEWTVKLGDLLTVTGAFIVAAGILYRRGQNDNRLETAVETALKEISELKAEFKKFGETMQEIAVQKMQLGLLMKWYDELRRGIGVVKESE